MKCRICSNEATKFLDLGSQPIANGFLTPEQFKDEYFYNLSVAFCHSCSMVQLVDQPDREKMFHDNYAFYSSTSKGMADHFERFAKTVIERYKLNSDSFVIEIGSNDGILLKHFAKQGIGHLGIEPSKNVADMAEAQGVTTLCSFFDDKLNTPSADVILSANVMAHIEDIHSVMRGVKNLLKPEGVLIFEDPYMGDILHKTSYDQIYDEHCYFFSLISVMSLVKLHDLEVIDVEHQETHGGSMRYTVAHKGAYVKSDNIKATLMKEYIGELYTISGYERFSEAVQASRTKLVDLLKGLGGNVVGYAATAKSATITNYCGITPDMVKFIYDTTPIKQGKFSPGAHIPIKSYDQFKEDSPEYAILFAWNHVKEIMAKEKDYKGKWITYVPEVKILEP